MIILTTSIDFRSLRTLERSSPTSLHLHHLVYFLFVFSDSHCIVGIYYVALLTVRTMRMVHLILFLANHVSCTECPSVNKVISLSNLFCDVLVYRLAFALLAFPWEIIFTSSGSKNLLE